jgi:uncharacterized membrane protein YecN with MAPEG domain
MRTAALYAGLHGLLLIALMASVSLGRHRTKAALGDAGDEGLRRRIRAHGNFIEYVPLTLLVIALAQHLGMGSLFVHLLGLVLLASRILHAYGISQVNEPMALRSIGISGTIIVLAIASIYCIIAGI